MVIEALLRDCIGFDWDEGNLLKNWERHQVSVPECEQLFFNRPLLSAPDTKHSQQEPRLYVLGHTDSDRRLFISFTIRNRRIRVICARDMNRKERKVYEAS